MDNPIFCAETNRQETKHESVNNITLFIFVQNRKKILKTSTPIKKSAYSCNMQSLLISNRLRH